MKQSKRVKGLIHKWEKQKAQTTTPEEEEQGRLKFLLITPLVLLFFCIFTAPVYASGEDPLTTINNLSDFIFGAIKAIGFIMLGFGIVQIGLSLKSHDASQRANGMMTFFGGVIIAFAKNILDLILA